MPALDTDRLSFEKLTTLVQSIPTDGWHVQKDAEVEPDGTCSFDVSCQPPPPGYRTFCFVGIRDLLTGTLKDLALETVPGRISDEVLDGYFKSHRGTYAGEEVHLLFSEVASKIAVAAHEPEQH